MKVALKAGAELDLLTPGEAREIVHEAVARLTPATPVPLRASADGVTDGAGAVTLEVYRPPLGMEVRLHRLLVEADGFTAAVPFNAAGAFAEVRVADRTVDTWSLVAGSGHQLPELRTDGIHQGPIAYSGEPVELVLVAGPVNTRISVFVQGTLVPRPGRALDIE